MHKDETAILLSSRSMSGGVEVLVVSSAKHELKPRRSTSGKMSFLTLPMSQFSRFLNVVELESVKRR